MSDSMIRRKINIALLCIISLMVVIATLGLLCEEPTPEAIFTAQGKPIPQDTTNVGFTVTAWYDLHTIRGGTAYEGFGSGCQGLWCGDWAMSGDSLSYQCFIVCDSAGFIWQYPNNDHFFPGLVTIVTAYEGKISLYASKRNFDFGSTNCLPGDTILVCDHHTMMCIGKGCGDVYYPKTYLGAATFHQGDKVVIMVYIDQYHKLSESNRANNWDVLPLRKDTTFFDPRQGLYPTWVLDTTALTNQNLGALDRWRRKNVVP